MHDVRDLDDAALARAGKEYRATLLAAPALGRQPGAAVGNARTTVLPGGEA